MAALSDLVQEAMRGVAGVFNDTCCFGVVQAVMVYIMALVCVNRVFCLEGLCAHAGGI